ncbi:MAG: radical SAM protein [Candidatus Hydrogenedentes bacterium]|nr:radical SAM protein [Candidatus Hydrogenedentota bacterium]
MTTEIQCKSILQKSRLPESPYCLNPYVGCTHRCRYCYARFMRRFTGHSEEEWGSFVDVKVNAPEVLARQLKRSQVTGPVLIGSVCDAYQPIENRYGITRACMELLVEHNVSFSVLTKSSLVTRDIDVLARGNEKVSVGISLPIHDEGFRKVFEPGTSTVQKRMDALKELHTHGIKTYVFIGPVLPDITDVESIVATVAPYADEIWGEAINLKCGNSSDLAEAYTSCGFSQDWQHKVRSQEYWHAVETELTEACKKSKRKLVGFYKH